MGIDPEKESELFCHKINIEDDNDLKYLPLSNFKEGKKILDNSGLKLISAENLDDAAKKIVEAIK